MTPEKILVICEAIYSSQKQFAKDVNRKKSIGNNIAKEIMTPKMHKNLFLQIALTQKSHQNCFWQYRSACATCKIKF